MKTRTEVTIEPEYYCPGCGHKALLRDCQTVFLGEARVHWCEHCRAKFQFELISYGLPHGGFQVVPDPEAQEVA